MHGSNHRRRVRLRPPAPGRARATRLTTLWPFAGAEQLPGTALLAGWLGRTILTLVTTYTRPGDRVLLLTPPTAMRASRFVAGRTRGTTIYAGLDEAVWTVTRLGRGVDTATAAPEHGHLGDDNRPAPFDRTESESRPGLRRPEFGPVTEQDTDSPRRCRRTVHRPRGRFDLIITAVDPLSTDWLGHTDLGVLLAPRGLAAVITHSETRGGRLLDPQSQIVDTLGKRGLRCLDAIAVLTAPVTPEAATVAEPVRGALPSHRAHHDLVLFGRLADAADRTEIANV
ncbi:hypothetical protein BS330_38590 [Amycolatopsis keratiniphila subsp. nogabecina]|nr:hypothetical protein BS330_38590 [Amycolatopsis keratiniphila subsp. nogabecina]